MAVDRCRDATGNSGMGGDPRSAAAGAIRWLKTTGAVEIGQLGAL